MTDTKRFQARPGYSTATLKLIERLKDGKVGDELTDEQLAEVAGERVAVGTRGYGHLMSAIRFCWRNHQLVWQRVTKAGFIRCLNPSEVIEVGEAHKRRASRELNRGTSKLMTVDLAKVDATEKTRLLVTMAQLGAMAAFATKKAQDRIERKAIGSVDQLHEMNKRVLEHFGS